MDFKFNKTLLLIGTLSCLLISTTAVPSTHIFQVAPNTAPTAEPTFADSKMSLFGDLLARAKDTFSPEIIRFCTGTENPTLCAQTISPYMEGSFDPVLALETEIKATLKKAKVIAANIATLLGNPTTQVNALDALGICKSQYGDMLDTINEALELVAQQNVVDAYYKFSSVISDKSTCDDAFQESPGVDMPFAKDSLELFQLGGNCLAIMDGIVNNNRL